MASIDNTTSQSVNRSATNDGGYNTVINNLRSVLMHRIGPPLMAYLYFINDHSDKGKELLYSIANIFLPSFDPTEFNDTALREDYDHVFEISINAWKNIEEKNKNEKALTKTISDLLVNILVGNNDQLELQVDNEKYVKNENNGLKGFTDILFSHEGSIVAIYEFGLHNDSWWTKLMQNTKYAQAYFDTTNNYKFDKPILLVTITMEESKVDGEVDAQFGVFLCTRKKKEPNDNAENKGTNNENIKEDYYDAEKYRMALLWRTKTDTIHDASMEFGKILYATHLCAKWRSQCEENSTTYGYLGPNCVRLGNKVRMSQLIIYVW
jgi:hypothetical protein